MRNVIQVPPKNSDKLESKREMRIREDETNLDQLGQCFKFVIFRGKKLIFFK